MIASLLTATLFLACAGDPPPASGSASSPSSATVPPAPPAPAVPPPEGGGTPVVYSAQNITTLQLSLPTRSSVTPTPTVRTPQLEDAVARLTVIVDTYAADPENPWAMGHGLLARGEGWKLADGSDVVDVLFARYAEAFPAGDTTLLRFPDAQGAIRIEPHAELLLKMLTEVGVSPERLVQVGGTSYPVMALYQGSLLSSYLDPQTNHSAFASPDDTAWALQGLAAWAPPGLVWLSLDGTPMSLDTFTNFHMAVLDQEMKPIADAMAVGADFEKKDQGIFRYTCGGAHLLQGTGYALARGFGSSAARAAFARQVELAYYRLPRELAIYDAAMKRFGEAHADMLLVQRLKFTGHFLESMHKLAAMGFYTPTAEQQVALEGAALQVALTLEGLHKRGVFDRMAEIRTTDEQLYLDIVGDSAHALHGLRLALGDVAVRY